ncbi:MAG: ABC transporter permease [Chloroflexota bacterium]|nr:ABC transporter permease [Chloroflexota bacterium]
MEAREGINPRTTQLVVVRPLLAGWQFMRRWPVIPLVILAGLVVMGLFAPQLAPRDPFEGSILDRHTPPFWYAEGTSKFPLGTDHAGRDILSRVIYGARISLMVAAISITSGFIVGTAIGVISGYLGGWWDEIIMRIVDIWYSLPFLMVALVVVIIFSQSLEIVLALLAMLAWAGFVRVVRAHTLTLKSMDYIALARVAGAGAPRIIARHIVPTVINTSVVVATLNVGSLIIAEATLSFLGAGIPAPTPAWGTMVAEGRNYVSTAWWQAVFPGTAIFLVVMSLNFLGDWLRDKLDPRLRQLAGQ